MAKGIDILRAFKYRVTIVETKGSNSSILGFSKISGLTLGASDVIEYREGNEGPFFRKLPGLHKYKNVILEKGKGSDADILEMERWRDQVSYYRSNIKVTDKDGYGTVYYYKTINIALYSRSGDIKFEWVLHNAWPTSIDYSDLDAQTSSFLIETIDIAYEGVEIIRHK